MATAVMLGYTRPVTQHATHYHTHAVNPVWNSGLVQTTSIGSHVFYRLPNSSERAYYQEALARRIGARRERAELIPDAAEEAVDIVEEVVAAPAEAEADEAAAAAVEAPAADEPVATEVAT